MNRVTKVLLIISAIALVTATVMFPLGQGAQAGAPLTIGFIALAVFSMNNRIMKGYAFTVWVFASFAASYYYPPVFDKWFGFDMGKSITPLIQIIMFGMGTTLSIKDFIRVAKMPLPIFLGMAMQFGLKPFVALYSTHLFGLTGPVAAGVVLIGSVPGGVASNLMTYLANGDVALSVTMTSLSTIMSPVFTPLCMKYYAGTFVPIKFISMVFSIINMIIVPVVAGLVCNRILYSKSQWANEKGTIGVIAVVCAVIAAFASVFPGIFIGFLSTFRVGLIIGFALLAICSLAKLILSLIMNGPENWMDRILPKVSMFGIVLIIAVITSRSTDALATAGLALIVCSFIQIAVGFIVGYWGSRFLRMDEKIARTVSIEIGLQNGGMASALAMSDLFEKAIQGMVALASVIYGPMMNVMGSMVATYWHGKPIKKK
jgi:bile acid:Na+ symporter, BASS family